jgi:mannan endo-1,4-beta-mannosidase
MLSDKRKPFKLACLLMICLLFYSFPNIIAAHINPILTSTSTPSNPTTSKEATDLLSYLYNIQGKNIISGQLNYIIDLNEFTDKTREISGKTPAIWASDFSFYYGPTLEADRQKLTDTAMEQWSNGSIISLCWHEQRPSDPYDAGWGSVQGSWYTDEEMTQLVTPGTDLYKQWIAQINQIVPYLKQLRDAGVPVLWRPYHENNAGWFWWGARPAQTVQLWKNLYNYMTKECELNNLLWVWSPASNNEWAEPLAPYYPGDEYVDVCSQDIYDGFKPEYYQELVDVSHGKPIGIGECGALPDIDFLKSNQPNYTYFMGWGKNLVESNTTDAIKNVYNNPYVLTQDTVQTNYVKNPEFDNGTDGWNIGKKGDIVVTTGTRLSGINALKVELTNGYSGNMEKVQVKQTIAIESGRRYTVSFTGKADASKVVEVALQKSTPPHTVYWSQKLDLSDSPNAVQYNFESKIKDPNAELCFNLGGSKAAVYLDRVRVTDWTPGIYQAPDAPPQLGTWVTVDDRNPAVTFYGNWTRNTVNTAYNSSETLTNVADNYAEFKFTGSAIQYIGSKQNNFGMVDVYIDGVKEQTLDLNKADNAEFNAVLYEKTGLRKAEHTIKIVAVSSSPVVLDAFKYFYELPPVPKLVNLVRNPELDNGTEGWYWLQSGDAQGEMSVAIDAGLSGNNALKAFLTKGGANNWNAQINQDFPITKDKRYKISFTAKADRDTTILPMIQQNSGSYSLYWYQYISITTTAKTYGPFDFGCENTDPASVLRFNLGGYGDNLGVYIDNVIITDGTLDNKPASPKVTADDILNRVTGMNSTMEYKLDEAETYTPYVQATFEQLSLRGDHILCVRVAAEEDNLASDDTILTFSAKYAEPILTADDDLNKVIGMNSIMEYKLDGAETYTPYVQAAFDQLDLSGDHILRVRVAADANNLESNDTALTFTTNGIIPETNNVINNSEFNKGTIDWEFALSGGAEGTMNVVTDAGLSGANALKLTVSKAGAWWDVQLKQWITIKPDKEYTLSFVGKADAPQNLNVQIFSNWASIFSQNIALTTSAQTFGPYNITFPTNADAIYLGMFFGDIIGNIYIDKVIISEVATTPVTTPVTADNSLEAE